MRVTPVSGIERETWGAASIPRIVNDGVYICTCSVRYDEYKCMKKHAFVFDSNFKPLHKSKRYGGLIDNIADAPICVLEDKERETKLNFRYALKNFFGGKFTVEYIYKITPCESKTCYQLYIFIDI